jgi:uncharacterized GH25 family protein
MQLQKLQKIIKKIHRQLKLTFKNGQPVVNESVEISVDPGNPILDATAKTKLLTDATGTVKFTIAPTKFNRTMKLRASVFYLSVRILNFS